MAEKKKTKKDKELEAIEETPLKDDAKKTKTKAVKKDKQETKKTKSSDSKSVDKKVRSAKSNSKKQKTSAEQMENIAFLNRKSKILLQVGKIISKLKNSGKNKIDEISVVDAFAKFDISAEEMDEVFLDLENEGIKVVGIDDAVDLGLDNISVNINTEDSVKLYLGDIGRYQLINSDEEVELAKKIVPGLAAREILTPIIEIEEKIFKETEKEFKENGIYSRSEIRKEAKKRILEANLIDPEERNRLEEDMDIGLSARNDLINANLRLVVSIAKRYVGRGLPFMDIIQEGNLGLQKAAEKFDHTKGFKFSTYATWWIRQSITRAIADYSRAIRVPVHKWEDINKLEKTRKRLTQTLERAATVEEIAKELDWTEKAVLETLRASQDVVSIDTPIGEEGDTTLADFVEDENIEAPDEIVEKGMMRERLLELLYELDPRETQVLIMRYGFDDGRPKTLEEVGRAFDVTRERVRQIEARAFKKLRNKLDFEKDRKQDLQDIIS